jgi:hypothetical protein
METPRIYIIGIVAILGLVFLAIALIQKRKKKAIYDKVPGYPEDHFLSQGIGIGMAVGAGAGVAMGNIAVGVAMGVAIGVAIGKSLVKKNADKIRPMTQEEKELKKESLKYVVGALVLGVLVFAALYFFSLKA